LVGGRFDEGERVDCREGAAIVVRRAIDRYRRLHQGPLVSRANELFTRFTVGSFVELFVDLERGQGRPYRP
jgi:uncharacterized protein YhaN